MIKKLSLIMLGISFIVIFELSLGLIGKIFLYARNSDLPLRNKESGKVVLCMGDSHTFGVGAPPLYSYPKQLERLLNLNNPENSFSVANLGIPGNSTKSQIDRLAKFLSKNRTNLVILLTGRNNYYEVEAWNNKSFPAGLVIKARKLKTYKVMDYALSKIFKRNPREDINGPVERRKYEAYMEEHLNRAKSLCEEYGSRLVLLSYYNSSDEYIEKFAKQSGIPFLNLCKDFPEGAVSRDGSHMNASGYKLFAEVLYEDMFLRRNSLNLSLNPPAKKIDKTGSPEKAAISYLTYAEGKSVFYDN